MCHFYDVRSNSVEEDGEYVVNIADDSVPLALHASSADLPSEMSEAETVGLDAASSVFLARPRLAAAPISMECRWDRTIAFSQTGGDFIVGTVLGWHIPGDVLIEGRVSTERLNPRSAYRSAACVTRRSNELPPVPVG